jgi:hypothetical protein
MSPCRRVSSHWSHQCGTTVSWRRGGSTHFSAQEDVFADSSACLEVVEGTLGGRASLDAIARSVAAGPIEVDMGAGAAATWLVVLSRPGLNSSQPRFRARDQAALIFIGERAHFGLMLMSAAPADVRKHSCECLSLRTRDQVGRPIRCRCCVTVPVFRRSANCV